MRNNYRQSITACVLALVLLFTVPAAAGASDDDFHLRYQDNIVVGYSVWGSDPTTPRIVNIPLGTMGIADDALTHMDNTEKIGLSYDLPWIGNGALASNPKLASIVIPESVQSIGSKAFAGDTALQWVSFYGVPETVAPDIFEGCDNLRQIEFWGTQEQWHALNIELPPNHIFVYGPDFLEYGPSGPSHGEAPEPPESEPQITVASTALPGVEQLSLRLNSNSGLVNADGQPLTLLEGIRAAKNQEDMVTAATLLGNLAAPFQAKILCRDGSVAHSHEGVATGDSVVICRTGSTEPAAAVTIVVSGDVLGTGTMDCAQVVRAARALNGTEPLTGVYQIAAGVTGHDMTISDLVAMAQMIQ